MLKKLLVTVSITLIVGTQLASAFVPKEITKYFNGPSVSSVTDTSATVTLSPAVQADIAAEEKSGIYFEYGETHQMCIMIYPTPKSCLPKKTTVGMTEAVLTNLKPNTSYTISYKRDNMIRCITTPCPGNDFQSLSVEFVTKASGTGSVGTAPTEVMPETTSSITKNLGYRSRGDQVTLLQKMLISQGHLHVSATGYFGVLTLQAVKNFQKANGISTTGFVGILTRGAFHDSMNITTLTSPNGRVMMINPDSASVSSTTVVTEHFEGTISAFSTQCFADGICSVTIGGKTVVTTIGWHQGPVGALRGVGSIGDLDKKIGSLAKVYAQKTDTGYTLYGNADYFVEVQ
jgi:hypothetical protein